MCRVAREGRGSILLATGGRYRPLGCKSNQSSLGPQPEAKGVQGGERSDVSSLKAGMQGPWVWWSRHTCFSLPRGHLGRDGERVWVGM